MKIIKHGKKKVSIIIKGQYVNKDSCCGARA